MELLTQMLDFILHIDAHLNEMIQTIGWPVYIILFLIVFCETGLVVTPFLPGDSLLFAAGALASVNHDVLNVHLLCLVLFIAAIIGDAVNYAVGHFIGPKVFTREDSIFLNKKHLLRSQNFYERYGGKTIVFARFIPILRTFAPFVAGIGAMKYSRFVVYNVFGAALWVLLFLYGGYFFGETEFVKKNFHVVIFAIIILSVLPAVIEFMREYYRAKKSSTVGGIV